MECIDVTREIDKMVSNEEKGALSLEQRLEKLQNQEQVYTMAIQDLCARYELTVSNILNIITEMNNTKNHYLKMLGQIRQQQQGESISSK